MFLFNRANNLKLITQALNLTALTIATVDLLNNPEKIYQNGFSIAVAALSYVTLSEKSRYMGRVFASVVNAAHLPFIVNTAVVGGSSSESDTTLALRAALHLGTAGILLSNSAEEDNSEDRAWATKSISGKTL